MNIGGGEAADQLVRMMLSFGEVGVRLGGSALKNVLALSMALAKNNKDGAGEVFLQVRPQRTADLRGVRNALQDRAGEHPSAADGGHCRGKGQGHPFWAGDPDSAEEF